VSAAPRMGAGRPGSAASSSFPAASRTEMARLFWSLLVEASTTRTRSVSFAEQHREVRRRHREVHPADQRPAPRSPAGTGSGASSRC